MMLWSVNLACQLSLSVDQSWYFNFWTRQLHIMPQENFKCCLILTMYIYLYCFILSNRDCVEQCAEKFRNQDPIHSACLPPPQGSFRPSEEGVTEADKEEILRAHNEYRRNVQPPATNMLKMVSYH